MNPATSTTDFNVVELRRYTIVPGAREHFGRYFESYFPEAFQQLGAIAFGQFYERAKPSHFTWLRGFRDMPARAAVNAAFYFGPVWKEHKASVNRLIADSDNVLLLRPLRADCALPVLPAVDPVAEPYGAAGIVVVQLFRAGQAGLDALAQEAERWFATYRAGGLVEAGILVTLDAPNNFPQHPVRSDGPYLAWLGVVKDERTLDQLGPDFVRTAHGLQAAGLLGAPPELIVLDPAGRSRLRWLRHAEAIALGSAA